MSFRTSFFAAAAIRYGARRFREELLASGPGTWRVGRWFEWLVMVALPVEFVALMGWWFYSTIQGAKTPRAWLHPGEIFSLGTCVVQWTVVLAAAALLSGWIHRRLQREDSP